MNNAAPIIATPKGTVAALKKALGKDVLSKPTDWSA
jgi:hypothetical protein